MNASPQCKPAMQRLNPAGTRDDAYHVFWKLARPARFERTTPAFGGQYSIQLSYGRMEFDGSWEAEA